MNYSFRPFTATLSLFALTISLSAQPAETVTLEPARDTTLFSEANDSNGQGSYLFAGQNNQGQDRRALLAFDLSALPDGALVQEASLTLNMNKTIAGEHSIELYRLTSNWGEGASDAPNNEGRGTAAEPGDASWQHTFFPDGTWNTPGGDFVDVASAGQMVSGTGPYTWTGSRLVEDVQGWIDDPGTSFGWILVGNETTTSAKRFDSRHASDASARPKLSITYIVREEVQSWADYPVEGDGSSVNTEGFLGWIDISQAPWIYIYSLSKFIYLPEENVGTAGGWSFVPAN